MRVWFTKEKYSFLTAGEAFSPSLSSLTADAEPFSLPRDQTESLFSPSLKRDAHQGSFLPLSNAPATGRDWSIGFDTGSQLHRACVCKI
ncbi:hypothetical protein TSUD_329890 [Trifolium subterraneum]|nr:hypothetical protein TSUD_329890 [Trifolium subterraneum]